MEGNRLRAVIGALAVVALAGVVVLERSGAQPSELVTYADPAYVNWLKTLEATDGGQAGEFTSSLTPMNGYELPLEMYYEEARKARPPCSAYATVGMNCDGSMVPDGSQVEVVEEVPVAEERKPCAACQGGKSGPDNFPFDQAASPLSQESVDRVFGGGGGCECDEE
ncbi:hypothetical protein T484DRAFT_1975386 [Baffinella frigidus]|nr:hypothetical protein T484DRAFT_1975386 [Cryptophyta sp. CCMP2293]